MSISIRAILTAIAFAIGWLLGDWVFAERAWADTRASLTLKGDYEIQAALFDPVKGLTWVTRQSGELNGGAFIQTQAESATAVKGCSVRTSASSTEALCLRLHLLVPKPVNQVATLAVQSPNGDPSRTFRVTAPAGSAFAELFINELSLDDYGQMAFQLVVQGAAVASYGEMTLRTFDAPPPKASEAALQANKKTIRNGEILKAGWWFLVLGSAPKLVATEDPVDLLSFCVEKPDGESECAGDGEMTLSLHATEKGVYRFTAWTKELAFSETQVEGV